MHLHRRLALATATAVALTGGLLTFAAAPATAADSTRVAKADFNGDGIGDLATSAATAYVSGHKNAGAVVVMYGSASGVNTASGAQSFAQSTTNVPGQDEKNDLFGTDVKLDDVTGDGKADLMVGSYENGGDGAVTYLPSDGKKITAIGSRAVSPADAGVSTTGVPQFGSVFAD